VPGSAEPADMAGYGTCTIVFSVAQLVFVVGNVVPQGTQAQLQPLLTCFSS
jgi:hypothetical protein